LSDKSSGALSAETLRWIVVDASHIDQKKRGIIEQKDGHNPLVRLLSMDVLKRGYDRPAEAIQLIFY
jgi:protein CMS1